MKTNVILTSITTRLLLLTTLFLACSNDTGSETNGTNTREDDDANTDVDADVDTDADTDADTDVDTDTDTDGDTDADAGEDLFIIPLSVIDECVELSQEEATKSMERSMMTFRGEAFTYISKPPIAAGTPVPDTAFGTFSGSWPTVASISRPEDSQPAT